MNIKFIKNATKNICVWILISLLTLNINAGVAFAQVPPPPPNNTPPPAPESTPPSAPESTPPPAPGEDGPAPTPTTTQENTNQDVNNANNSNDTEENGGGSSSGSSDTQSSSSDSGSSASGSSGAEGAGQQPSGNQIPTGTPTGTPEVTPTSTPSTGGSDVDLTSGDSNSDTLLVNNGNLNAAGASAATTGDGSGVSIVNADNGSTSTNNGSATINNSSSTIQENTAVVKNQVTDTANTGDNNASKNTAVDTNLTTGDANVSGTIINNLNTNAAGLMVSEFNVVDDQVGDLVLDFVANCISGCAVGEGSITNSGNGAGSQNNGVLTYNNSDSTFQANDATVENSLVLKAESGDNNADKNTGGNTSIQTGDANVSANVINNINNNLAGGQIVYGVVNIYGDLVGDIVFPEEVLGNCCGTTSGTLANTGNGAESENTTSLNSNNTNEVNQSNTANIENVILVDANTGDNTTDKNTNGSANIITGESSVNAQVVNVANSNLAGGNWWLVLVNEAGKWVGKIVGSPDGATMAWSAGTTFTVDDNGQVSVTNNGNGAETQNSGTVNTNNTNSVTQSNTTNLVNTLDLSANTGQNSASKNTGGSSSIETGDAQVMANILNFVNNNITGGGKLFVTVVNVFGSWLGNFVSPDATQEELAALSSDNHNTDGDENKESAENIGGAEINIPAAAQEEYLVENETVPPTENNELNDFVQQITRVKKKKVVASTVTETIPLSSGSVLAAKILKSGEGQFSLPDDATPTANQKQKVEINLAWLILSLPIGIIAWISKRFDLLAYLRTLIIHT